MPRPRDDRGRPCREPATLPAGAVHQGVGGGSRRVVSYYALVGVSAGMMALAWTLVIDPVIVGATGVRTRAWGAAIAASVVALLTDRALARRIARGKWNRIRELALSARACPACGYALEGLTPETDGCVVCPECGAAWRPDSLGDRDRDPNEHTRVPT